MVPCPFIIVLTRSDPSLCSLNRLNVGFDLPGSGVVLMIRAECQADVTGAERNRE